MCKIILNIQNVYKNTQKYKRVLTIVLCFSTYFCIFLYISVYVRAYLQLAKSDSPRNLLPNRAIESFWDALWLELWPFLYFD